jgi:hypothetical protein
VLLSEVDPDVYGGLQDYEQYEGGDRRAEVAG